MTAAGKALERGRAAIARQKEREATDMAIGVGENARITRAQQVVLDRTGVPEKDAELIQAAIDVEVQDAIIHAQGNEAFEAGKAAAAEELSVATEALRARVAELEASLAAVTASRDGLASEVGTKLKAVREAEGLLLGQEDIIKGLREENEALKETVARLEGPPVEKDEHATTQSKGSKRR